MDASNYQMTSAITAKKVNNENNKQGPNIGPFGPGKPHSNAYNKPGTQAAPGS